MNEIVLGNSIRSSEFLLFDTELVVPDTEYGENSLEFDTDSVSDSDSGYGVSDVDLFSVSTYASYTDFYMMLSTSFESYFAGVLQNIGDTEYVAYCLRDFSSTSYVDHYVLWYDLEVENDVLVGGDSAKYIDIYRSSSNSDYVVDTGTGSLSTVPDLAYGSFGTLSDLREGVSYNEIFTILFFLGFFTVYIIVHDIFDYVLDRVSRGYVYRSKGSYKRS